MRRATLLRPTLIVIALFSALPAEDSVVPGGGPLPRLVPQVPGMVEAPSPEQQLLWQLGQRVQEHDHRIAELSAKLPVGTPLLTIEETRPELEKPRRERDQALAELQRVVDTFGVQRGNRNDVLETARPVAKTIQTGPLVTTNQLRVAECFQELMQDGGTLFDLAAGTQALTACDPAQLPANEQPRFHYLRVWFAAEAARRATGEERAQQLAKAQEAQRLLNTQYPGLELTVAAQALTLDLVSTDSGAVAP